MRKKIFSLILALIMLLGVTPASLAADPKPEKAQAAYGTPTIDGVIDDVWNNTNYNVIDIKKYTATDMLYRGWFKVMWDAEQFYVLAKVYGESFTDTNDNAWENDSFEVFIDEDGARTTKYLEDDYQLRSDFKGFKSGQNYDLEKMTAAATLEDDYYIVEMAFPMKTVELKSGLKMGFDIQVNCAPNVLSSRAMYGWNELSRSGAVSTNTSIFGEVELLQAVSVQAFDEPEVLSPFAGLAFSMTEAPLIKESVSGEIVASFDGNAVSDISLAYCDENPCIEINDLARLIDGTVENGNTLKKDKVTIKYIEGDRLAEYTHADYPNRADYMTTYYFNTSNLKAKTTEPKLAAIEEQLIPGETAHNTLPENYVNNGTDGENNGYILEVPPFKMGTELFVPISSLIPTLNYYIEYNRFATPKTLTITSGTGSVAYPAESEYKVFYVKDYNAKGDGVTDDKEAVLNAFYAALNHDGPAKLEFEPNKTYRVSAENTRIPFFWFQNRNNFILEGNGSTIQFMYPLNTFFYLTRCKNVQLRNLTSIYEEHTTTQGIIDEINVPEGWFKMTIPEGYRIPPETAFTSAIGGNYGLSIVFDPEEKHMKFLPVDWFNTTGIEHLEDRQVKVTVQKDHAPNLKYLEVGDGYIPGQSGPTLAYGISKDAKGDGTPGITINFSEDILIDGITLTGSLQLGCSVGMNTGTIQFKNYKMRTKDGAANASNSDGIHYWRNRASLLVEDCEFWNNMDDHINTKGERAIITKIDGRSVTTNHNQNYKQGDEVLIYKRDSSNDELLLRAFVESVTGSFNAEVLTLDRDIPESVHEALATSGETPILYNQMSCGSGASIRGSKFINSRRHALISRAENSIFMNNYVQNNGGSSVEGADETTTSEGPFPNAFTVRNNRLYGDGMTSGSHTLGAIVFRNYGLSKEIEPQIDGVLVAGNIIQIDTQKQSILINSVKDLYMMNNTIKWSPKWNQNHTDLVEDYKNYVPVLITNTEIEKIDGLHFDYDLDVNNGIVQIGVSDVDESKITNITKKDGNNSKLYTILN